MEPEFANAYALLGICHAHIGVLGWMRPVRHAYEKARAFADEAIRLAPSSPETNYALAMVLVMTGKADQAKMAARRALDRNPNFAEARAILGMALTLCGELKEGLATCHQAAGNNPRETRDIWLYNAMGHAYFMLGEYDQAIDISKKGLHQDPTLIGALLTLAGTYAVLGRKEEANHYIEDLLRLIPRYSLRALRKSRMFVDPELIEKLVESLRLAGLPE